MFKSKVCVCSDEAGAIIVQTENPDYGYIRLEQTKTNFKKGAWGARGADFSTPVGIRLKKPVF